MKPKILFIMHMPPPVHGAAMMGQYIHDSRLINESFDCHYINLTTAKNLEDIGRLSLRKIKEFIQLLKRVKKAVKEIRPDLVYVTPNASGGAFYKDFTVVEILKCMGCKVILHYHNKGVTKYQDHLIDNLLYRFFFFHVKIILLTDVLYKDVCKYVKKKNVWICPNGIPDIGESFRKSYTKMPHLLFLSNLLVSKGIFVLLDACEILKDQGVAFKCDIVGGETKELSEEGLEQYSPFKMKVHLYAK